MNSEDLAYSKLYAGCNAEKSGDFNLAAREYRSGLEFVTEDFDTAYFLNNNLGYSLIQLGDFVEAEIYCREAILIDPHRYNSYKNLGLALQGQGQFIEAALALQLASVMSSDPRAEKHLEELLSVHPEAKSSLKTYTVIESEQHIFQGQSSSIH
jgi:tetratricopeptide (TPR) repeat protein